VWRSSRWGRSCASCRPRAVRRSRCAPTGWTCCAGFGSCGPWGGLGPGRARRGAGFLPLAAGGRQATAAALAPSRRGGDHGLGVGCGFADGGHAVCGLGAGAQRDGAARLLRLSPRRRHRADPQPLPAGPLPAGPARPCPPQPDGAPPQPARRALPADSAHPDPPQHPRRGVQRAVRQAAVAPRPGAGGLLRLHRRPRLRAAVGHPGRRGPGTAADRRSPQGQPAPPGAAGVHRRVRVVAALPAGAGRRHPTRAAAAAVVDAAPPAPAAFLPRGASHVRAGRRPRASR
jgi:hypothetical protein